MRVFLAEKPDQGRRIAEQLGGGPKDRVSITTPRGIVTWCIGHLFESADPAFYNPAWEKWTFEQLPMLPEKYLWLPRNEMKGHVQSVGALLKRASEIVVATDPDREGEMIAREVMEHFPTRVPVKRLWLRALDAQSIQKALNTLRDGKETEPMFWAARARSSADWLVGMNVTRSATLAFRPAGAKGVYSVGRVQTPTLGLVVRRDYLIENFKPVDYFEVALGFQAPDTNGTQHVIRMVHSPGSAKDPDARILDKGKADAIAEAATDFAGPLAVHRERKRASPPKLFTLSTLQQACSAKFGWSADHTLAVAQSLYEKHAATSYPRSDCPYLPAEQAADVPAILRNLQRIPNFSNLDLREPIIRNSVFDSAKITAHHAIIPTTQVPSLSAMSADERSAYMLIAAHYVAAMMPDHEYEATRISLDVRGSEFVATGKVSLVPGWQDAFSALRNAGGSGNSDSESDPGSGLPTFADRTHGRVQDVEVVSKKTTPPDRYTEGTLIADMLDCAKFIANPELRAILKECKGIGTEATRASIIKTLRDRGYLVAKGKKIISTPPGRTLIAHLSKHCAALVDVGETALWERRLAEIEEGRVTMEEFDQGIRSNVSKYVCSIRGVAPSAATAPRAAAKPLALACPVSKKAVEDHGTHFVFPGFRAACFKEVSGRKMSAEDYLAIFEAHGAKKEPPIFEGFFSKTRQKAFSAGLRFNPSGERSKFEFVFAERQKVAFKP